MSHGVLNPAGADELARAVVDEHRLVGLVAGTVEDGDVTWAGTFGCADLVTSRPMTAATTVRIGSITKTMTAVAVMQLVERGVVTLDDPVPRHLRAYPFRSRRGAREITIGDVLTHTSGMGEWRRVRELLARRIPFAAEDGAPVPSLAEFYRGGLRADTPPGQRYAYANHAFASLGQLVEEVTGVAYTTYMHENLFAPLRMTNASVLLTAATRESIAQGYDVTTGEPVSVPYQHIVIAPAGAVHASLDDMLRYASWLATGGDRPSGVLRPETLALMFERHWEPDVRLPGQGLGFARDDVAGHTIVGHDGGWPGFTAALQVVPGMRFAAFAATNTFALGPRVLTDRLVEQHLGIGSPAARVAHAVDVPADQATRFVGVYAPAPGFASNARWWNEFGGEVRIERQGRGLVLSTPKGSHAGGVALAPGDPDDDRYWVGAATRLGMPMLMRLRFRQDAQGGVTGFDGALPAIASMRRRPAVRSVRFYRPAAIVTAATAGALAVSGVLLRARRRVRARSGRTPRRSPRR
jgi:CubicO group peptidase (beta-lactamase class C family)